MADERRLIQELTGLIVERKVREADHSSGDKVKFGSGKHVRDLKKRIAELTSWRNKHKRGSEKRAHYSRLIQQLKQELASAQRHAEKQKG